MRQSDVGEGGLAARRRRRARYDAGVETLADHGVHEPLALLVVTPLLFQNGLHFGKNKNLPSKRLFTPRRRNVVQGCGGGSLQVAIR